MTNTREVHDSQKSIWQENADVNEVDNQHTFSMLTAPHFPEENMDHDLAQMLQLSPSDWRFNSPDDLPAGRVS